ncbi:MAG: hypothetical protein R3F11_26015 [Verrucomicrobiales bacterium]
MPTSCRRSTTAARSARRIGWRSGPTSTSRATSETSRPTRSAAAVTRRGRTSTSQADQGRQTPEIGDDFDGNGISNFAAFAFAPDPTDGGDLESAQGSRRGRRTTTFEYTRSTDDSLMFAHFLSEDLIFGAPATEGVDYTASVIDNGDGTETVTVVVPKNGRTEVFFQVSAQ